MARIKIDIPEKMLAVVKLPVRITDINYGNHLGNDALVSFLHESRVQRLTSLAYSELNINDVGLIMSDLCVEYKNESFYGDYLSICLYAGEVTPVSFELYYTIINQENKLIAKAKTGIVCYNYELKKVVTIPEKLKELLE
jgi:acyl-CoA thioester hydrolase